MTTALDPSQRAVAFGAQFLFQDLSTGGKSLQQRISVIAMANTAASNTLVKTQIFTAAAAGALYGFGSQIHAIAQQLFPANGVGVGNIPVTVYPLADGTTVATAIMTPTGTTTVASNVIVTIGGVSTPAFAVPSGAAPAAITVLVAAAINNTVDMPVTAVSSATIVTNSVKWKGLSGNGITTTLVSDVVSGATWVNADTASGAGDPEIDSDLLDQFGSVWETIVVNGLGGTTAALDALAAFDEGMRLPLNGRPLLGAFYASTETDVSTAIVIPDARGTDKTNTQLSAPGSADMQWTIAARFVARIARVANSSSPGTDYVSQIVDGIEVGTDGVQWTAAQRQTAVLAGTSTTIVQDSVIKIQDTISFHHPTGDPTPSDKYVADKNKVMQVLNELKLEFDSAKWQAPPLIPDGQATIDRTAKKPEMAVATIQGMIENWGLRAIISAPEVAKATVTVAIDGTNNRRLNIFFQIQISGNAGVISADVNYGFYNDAPVAV